MFMSTTEECKKLSLKMMEKKDRRRKRKEDGPTAAPRKGKQSPPYPLFPQHHQYPAVLRLSYIDLYKIIKLKQILLFVVSVKT